MCVSKYLGVEFRQIDSWQKDSQKSPPRPQCPLSTGVLLCSTYTSRHWGQPVYNISAPDSCFVPLLYGFVHRPETGCLLNDSPLSPSLVGLTLAPSVPSLEPSSLGEILKFATNSVEAKLLFALNYFKMWTHNYKCTAIICIQLQYNLS